MLPIPAEFWGIAWPVLGAVSAALSAWFVAGRQRRWLEQDRRDERAAAALQRVQAIEDQERRRREDREDRERIAATLAAQTSSVAESLAAKVVAESRESSLVAGHHADALAAQTTAAMEFQRLDREKQTLVLAGQIEANTHMNEQALSAANNFSARLSQLVQAQPQCPIVQVLPAAGSPAVVQIAPGPAKVPPAAALVVEQAESVQVITHETPEQTP